MIYIYSLLPSLHASFWSGQVIAVTEYLKLCLTTTTILPTHRAGAVFGLQSVSAVAAAALTGLTVGVAKLGCRWAVKADGAHLLFLTLPAFLG